MKLRDQFRSELNAVARRSWGLVGVLFALVWAAACQQSQVPTAQELLANLEPTPEPLEHVGPKVAIAEAGPARFVRLLYNSYGEERAMEVIRFLDDRHRTAASPGYNESLDEIERRLVAAGFGSQPGLELEILSNASESPAWVPQRASLRLRTDTGGDVLLHSFDDPSGRDRCMLPENAPSCVVEAAVALSLGDLNEGQILVTEAAPRPDLILRARRKGAVALVSASLGSYNTDPTGAERHLDAIQFRKLESGSSLPVAMISQRSYGRIVAAHEAGGGARLRLEAEVKFGDTTLRTLVATIVGATRPDETVVLPSHILAPGAADNASGAAGILEGALVLSKIIAAGTFERPDRSLTFIWGAEISESELWLEHTKRTPVASVHAVMIGESRAETGAVPLLERTPDPGAVEVIEPDQHTLWGARDVEEEWLVPNGLSIIARCAMVDVARHVGGWETFENPYEGGTDHDVFVKRLVPAVLFWHFTDFTFHTSLDRIEMIDPEELQRTAVSALATALAIADPKPTDLERYLKSMLEAKHLRVGAALAAEEPEVALAWEDWFRGVRHWFRVQCLGLTGEDAILPSVPREAEADEE